MTLIWSTKTTPLMSPPAGNETSNGQSRSFRVMGQTTSTEDWLLYCRPESTRAGRRPPCSRPVGGPKSSHSTSPASGASASLATLHLRLTLHGFPLLIRGCHVTPVVVRPRDFNGGPVLEGRRFLPRLDLRKQIFQPVVRNSSAKRFRSRVLCRASPDPQSYPAKDPIPRPGASAGALPGCSPTSQL